MPLPPPLKIDPSNRAAHSYLVDGDECFFFHEYTAREGPKFSAGNQLVWNLKKPVTQADQGHYRYKQAAIDEAAAMLSAAFDRSPWVYTQATIAAIPPSKPVGHAEYDDRMTRVVMQTCAGKGADVRELLVLAKGYEASHKSGSGARLKPGELQALYTLTPGAPRQTIILVDDVLTTGAHFVACRNVIRTTHPAARVIGFFVARRVVPDPAADFGVV